MNDSKIPSILKQHASWCVWKYEEGCKKSRTIRVRDIRRNPMTEAHLLILIRHSGRIKPVPTRDLA